MGSIAATLSLNVPSITALCRGPRGSIILTGQGAPTVTAGMSGDYYIDVFSADFYGPKSITWSSTPLFKLSYPLSSFPYTITTGNTSTIIPLYGNNTLSGFNSNILGGNNNFLNGRTSSIIGGSGNSLTGNNSFIIGSNIRAFANNFTFINNLSSNGIIYVSAGNSNNWNAAYTAVSPNSSTWNQGGLAYTTVNAQSSVYTTVNTTSGRWSSVHTSVNTNSANWQSTYTAYNTTSAGFITTSTTAYTNLSTLSSIRPFFGGNLVTGCNSTIGGGILNGATGCYSSIAGGQSNETIANYSVIGGGLSNTASGYSSVIGGGCDNSALSGYSVVIGGQQNCVTSEHSVIGGGILNEITSTSNVLGCNVIGGGESNSISCSWSGIVGGCRNIINSQGSFIAGGCRNRIDSGFNNTFILGTGLSAIAANYTYVNNISAQNIIATPGGTSTSWNNVHTHVNTTSSRWDNAYTYLNTSTAATVNLTNLTVNNNTSVASVTETRATPVITNNILVIDLSAATLFSVNFSSNINTITITNPPPAGKVGSFTLQFVGTGSIRTVNWPANVRWQNGLAPAVTTAANKVDTFVLFTHDGGVNYFAFVGGQNM